MTASIGEVFRTSWSEDKTCVAVSIPLKLVNGTNVREHWSVRSKRVKAERKTACLITPAGLKPPLVIKLVRIYPRRYKPMDTDGLAAAFKAIRDGIADKIGVDDGSPLLTWEYDQNPGDSFFIIIDIKVSESVPLRQASAPQFES